MQREAGKLNRVPVGGAGHLAEQIHRPPVEQLGEGPAGHGAALVPAGAAATPRSLAVTECALVPCCAPEKMRWRQPEGRAGGRGPGLQQHTGQALRLVKAAPRRSQDVDGDVDAIPHLQVQRLRTRGHDGGSGRGTQVGLHMAFVWPANSVVASEHIVKRTRNRLYIACTTTARTICEP